ncbi:MAG: AAA-like domain-containing protein [Cyanobacteria bacterium P01_F01_bin.150]
MQHQKRKRGVILTHQGLRKLQAAKSEAEYLENAGNRYTLEMLSERIGLSTETIAKVLTRDVKVDKQTLCACFNAFYLDLEIGDYEWPASLSQSLELSGTSELYVEGGEERASGGTTASSQVRIGHLALLNGPIPLGSTFYIERHPIEARCYEMLSQPGALMRIKASKQMGKTSLMARILEHSRQQQFRTVAFNLRLANEKSFANLDRFLQWFCASVTQKLGLPNKVSENWDEIFGSSYNSTEYFESYLLQEIQDPLVLVLDDVDHLFDYPELSAAFLGLLRTWYEKARYGDEGSKLWQKLRLLILHSTEVYIPLSTQLSPFNVGLSIELPEFTESQVQDLAQRYSLNWSTEQAKELIDLVGGHPYRIRLMLHHLCHQDVTLEQLNQTFSEINAIYHDHLRRQLWLLQKSPELVATFAKVLTEPGIVDLDPVQIFKLQGLGLVHVKGRQVMPSCKLYHQYFYDYLNS